MNFFIVSRLSSVVTGRFARLNQHKTSATWNVSRRQVHFITPERVDGRSVIEGTASHDNLKQAFAEEAMACLRYQYFARIADQEGFAEVAQAFRNLAEAERLHCFRWLEHLQHVADPLTNEPIGDTFTNLQAAITSELHDNKDMYPKMAATAKTEGFTALAQAFLDTSLAEGRHAKKLQDVSKDLQAFLHRAK